MISIPRREAVSFVRYGVRMRLGLVVVASVALAGCAASADFESETEDFIDMPMKTYSAGMRARLTFSIATARRPDILLIDEALAVGDESFRSRCAERIEAIRSAAGAVVLVSHNMAEIRSSCSRVLWLESGVVRMDGEPEEVIPAYGAAQRERAAATAPVRRDLAAGRPA